jgi:hypothetical protein
LTDDGKRRTPAVRPILAGENALDSRLRGNDEGFSRLLCLLTIKGGFETVLYMQDGREEKIQWPVEKLEKFL